MGLYRAISQIDGQEYPFEIDGDTPTEEESLAISNYMANIGKQNLPEDVPGDDGNLFTKGIARGIDNIQLMYGSAIEGVGDVTGLEGLKNYGAEVVENNKKELESEAEYAKRLDDIKDTGSFFDWAASTLGEQVPQLGSTIAGAGAGFLVGGPVGSIIGGIGVNLPFFYGGNREAQKEEIEAGNRLEISESAAFLTSIPQSALDFIADRFLISGFTGKALSGGGLFTRGVKGLGKGVVTEVPTEVGQQVLERYQAGKSLTSEEAINEYKEVAAAAGLIGGTVSSTGNIIGGDKSKKLSKTGEMLEDFRAQNVQAKTMNQNAQNFLNRGLPSPTTEGKIIETSSDPEAKFLTLSMLPDHIRQEVMDNRPDIVVTDETLTQDDLDVALNRAKDLEADPTDVNYNKVKDVTKLEGVFNQGSARKALKTKQQKTIKQSEINRIRDKLIQNGVVKKKKGKFVPTTTTAQDIAIKAEQLKARAKTIMKEMDALHKQRKQRLETKEDVSDLENQITDLTVNYDSVSKQARTLATEAKQKLGTEAVKASQIVPPIVAKTAFNNAGKTTAEYKSKSDKVFDALSKSLAAIGLTDIGLKFKNIITQPGLTPQQQIASGTVAEGVFKDKVIALAMEIYDPSLTEAELQQRLGSVMNHEIIHALFELGLFTDQEQKILIDAANKKKYVVMIDGKPTERQYTYMERAAKMYPDLKPADQAEEAIAEMYRDYADGKIKFAGKPKSLFDRIINFIKSIFLAHKSQGFNEAGDIFENIGTTDLEKQIGRRERNENIRSEAKHSTAGIVAGYIEPEKGNIERIKQSFKDVTKRVDALTEAAERLYQGEIDFETYDKLVNDVKPIVPYKTVPAPATKKQMENALTENQRKIIGNLNQLEEGTPVKLRLDIPAYTRKNTWVPTIHNMSGKPIAHESTAIVTNADFTMSEAEQALGLNIAREQRFGRVFRETGDPDAKGVQKRTKTPYATITGNLVKTNPEISFAEAQAALNDPSFIQVGFDPERHSYFYDRTTTQPVLSADRVIQVGPLVMAQNPVFGRKQDYKYSTIGFAKPEPLDNRLLNIIRTNPDGFTVDPDSLEDMSSGIAVAPVKAAEIKVKPQDLNEEILYQFAENLYIMSQLSGQKIFAGGWTGPDGMFYLDATMLVDDFADALYIGEAAEQEGIFNLNNFEYTDTQDGIKQLQEANTYNGKRRAERQADIRKLTEEFKKTRYQRQAEQKSRVSSPARIEAGQERDVKEQVGYYPTVDENGYTILTHYSEIDTLAVVSPDKEGTNFNIRGQEARRRATFPSRYPARNYYGLNVGEKGGYRQEAGVGDNVYKAKIEVNRLYPLDADPNGYRDKAAKQAQEEEQGGPDTGRLAATLLEKNIKDDGFVGYWTGQQLGMVAAIFDDVAVLPEGQEKFSVKGVTPQQLTNLDRLVDGKFEQRAPVGTVKMTDAVKKAHEERGGITLNINDAEDRELAIQAIELELEEHIKNDDSAIGWYSDVFKLAKKLYAVEYPEILTDPNAESAFEFILAITSNGAAVKEQNASLAEQFENWRETGLLLVDKYGQQGVGMEKAFRTYNLLKTNLNLTDAQIKQWFKRTATVREINNLPVIKELNQEVAGENKDQIVPFSYILGSKIGSFYQNLTGDYSHLTMDRWFMRFANRILGTPFIIPKESTISNNRRDLKQSITNVISNGTEDEKTRLKNALEENGIDLVSDNNVDDIAYTVTREVQRDFGRAQRKNLPFPIKTTFINNAESLVRNLDPQMKEAPTAGGLKKNLRYLMSEATSRYNRKTNRPITVADAQAVFWYAEKRYFMSIGVRPGVGSDNDYVDAAIDFLRKRGIDDETIGQTLPAAERNRLADKSDTRGESIRTTGEPEQNIGHEKREYTPEELNEHDFLSESSDEEIKVIEDIIEDQKFSLLSIPEELKSNIYSNEGNAKKYIYGMINARGRTLPVLYVTGDHAKLGPNDYTGYGQEHIDAIRDETGKSHTQELLEVFKYKTVKRLLYDNLAKAFYQQTKGQNNGFNLVDTPSTGIRLEFNKTPHNGPRNYQLIIPLKFVPKGTPLDPTSPPMRSDVYVIRTAYPTEKLFKYSTIGSATMNQQETATSEVVNEGINQTRQKIRYDNLSRVLSKIGYVFTAGRVDEETLRKKAQNLLIQVQDRFLPIGTLIDNLREKGLNISDSMDTYMQEELFHGVAGAKVDKSQKEFFEPMIKVIDSLNVDSSKLEELSGISGFYRTAVDGRYPSKKMALADAILYASHAKERNDYLKNPMASGMHTNEANRILQWAATLPQVEKDKIDGVLSFAKQIVENTNQERRQGGLIPERFVDKDGKEYTQIYDNYVPLRGDLDFEQEIDADNNGEERRENFVIQNLFGALKRPDRKARGRIRSQEGELKDYYASDIVASLFAQNNKSIADAERNKVGLSYLQLVRGIADGETEVNVNLQKEMQHISHVYFSRDDIPQDMKDRVLTVRENGRNVFITFTDARIARAMKGMMTPDSVGSFTRALGKLNRYLSNINTTYNPSFVIPNFARDLATAGVNVQQYDEKGITSEVLKGALPAVKGIAKNLRDGDTDGFWAKEYLKFVNAGGKNATNQMNDLQDQMNRINGILSDVADNGKKGKLGLVKNGFKWLGNFLDDYNTAVENGVRVATYTALVKRGVTPARAAQAARNITVNFAKGGEQKQFLNSWYLFYNASLQGSMALINAAVKSKRVRKVWAGLVVYGLMQDAFNSMLSGDEDEDGIKDYDELPRYILEHNFVLPTFGLADDKFITIPLAYGMNIAVNLGRAMSRAARGEYTPGEASRTIFGTAFESLSPFGGFDNFYNLAAPTVLDPFVSVAINEDYKGDPIFKESPQFASRPTPNSHAYWSSTSGTAKTIAKTINSLTGGDEVESGFIDLSPDVMEFWFDYTTGGVGRFVQRSAEAPFNIIDAINGDFQGSITMAIPFARKVVASPSEREDVSNYLENRKALFTILARFDLARRSGDSEQIKEVLENNKKELAIVPRLKAIDNARNRLLRQIRELERNPRIEDKVKRNLIRIRRDRINDLMRRGLILMRSAGFREAS